MLTNVDVIPCFPNLKRGEPAPLKVSPDGKKLLYALGKTVVIRDIVPEGGNMIKAQLYTQHQYDVTAVAMAPSGCYMATGDRTGVVRIWACDNPEQILKLETAVFGGAILDIAWSPDNQRVVAVGDGREIFGKVLMWDSGNSVGDISGHAKKVNSCAYRPERPFRICTGGEDGAVNWYEGPPFKFKAQASKHTNFTNCVRFSPKGEFFFSVSNDMMLKLYDGKEGTLLKELKPHTGSIYAASWSVDGSKIVTCSADKTVKVLSVSGSGAAVSLSESAKCEFGKSAEFMQVGCAWSAAGLLSYGLNGTLSILSDSGKVSSTQVGHNRSIASIAMCNGKLLSASFEDAISPLGCIRAWDLATGVATPFVGADGSQKGGHASMVIKMGVRGNNEVVTIGRDDSVLFSSAAGVYGTRISTDSAPVDLAVGNQLAAIVVVTKELKLTASNAIESTVPLPATPTCVAVSKDDATVAVGCDDNIVHLFDGKGVSKGIKLVRHRAAISCVAFSADSAKLASGCANKEIVIWSAKDGTPLVTGLQGFHTTRIACMTWSSGGTLATGGVDSSILVWTDASLKIGKPAAVSKLCHGSMPIQSLVFVAEDKIASAGQDACIKFWTVPGGPVDLN